MTSQQSESVAASGAAGAAPGAAPQRAGRRVALGVASVAVVGAGAAAYVLMAPGSPAASPVVPVAAPAVAPAVSPRATLLGTAADGTVAWDAPLAVRVDDGTLTAVTGTGPDGSPVMGAVGADGTWTSTSALAPTSGYQLVAAVRDQAGRTRDLPLSATTGAPANTLKVTITPGDSAVVGVGQAIDVRLGTAVKDQAARAALEQRLTVTSTPSVPGAWRWVSSTELRYRGADYWPAGATISVTAAVDRLQVVPGVWGSGSRTSTFTVGDAITSLVDTRAHTMTVSKNGQVLRVMKASMGKPQFATRNGNFVVLEKFADRVMDSATVDLPPGTPAYKTAVKDAVRITNSGTFTHGAPWSVSSQGRANVSHGCINLSPADADWFYKLATRGDVVTVVNSTTGPNLSDAGSQDWNMSFDQWKSGSALA